MLRNREILTYIGLAGGVGLTASLLCFAVSPAAGVLCLLGCCGVFAVFLWITVRRYRQINHLNSYLQKLTRGEAPLDIRDNVEGELSLLKNEIYKMSVALTEQARSLYTDKAELANALSDISHQLKTPLTSLGIMTDLLENNEVTSDKRREFIASIRVGLDRMEWLVLTLLKLARLDADAAVLKREPVALSQVVERALCPLRIPMEIRDQTLSVLGRDAAVACDPDWTREALENILKNAIENTPEGGCISISYGENPIYMFISVSNDGPGIDPADLPHVFKRFYRGRGARRESAGIGLAMSLAVMRKQNGNIEVSNNGGSVFTMTFFR